MESFADVSNQRDLAAALGRGMQYKSQCRFDAAARAFSVAAQCGNAVAQYQLGRLYLRGAGVTVDHARAAYWWERSADQGYVKAQACLGALYKSDDGVVTADLHKAAALLTVAAAKGNPLAQYHLGDMCARGRGMTQDFVRASDLFERAAAQGCGPAQYRLGLIYINGLGVKRDRALATHWLRLAADQGCALAMSCLAQLATSGDISDYLGNTVVDALAFVGQGRPWQTYLF